MTGTWWNGVRGRTPSRNSRQTLSPMDLRFQNPGVRWKSQRSFCSSLSCCCGGSSAWIVCIENCWVQTTKRNTFCKLLTVTYVSGFEQYHFIEFLFICFAETMVIPRKSNIQYSWFYLLTWSNSCIAAMLHHFIPPSLWPQTGENTAPVLCIVSGPQLVFYSSLDLSSASPRPVGNIGKQGNLQCHWGSRVTNVQFNIWVWICMFV